jgi:hypothetical protein
VLVPVQDQADLLKLDKRCFALDPHLPDVLAFAAGTDLHDSPLYLDGTLILQDKASCMPAHAVNPPKGATCVDACAAPGNKTSHLASLMGNSGTVVAYDTDARRLALLRRLVAKAGATCVVPRHASFLDADTSDDLIARATHVLVDPSCSGSGMMPASWDSEVSRASVASAMASAAAAASTSSAHHGGGAAQNSTSHGVGDDSASGAVGSAGNAASGGAGHPTVAAKGHEGKKGRKRHRRAHDEGDEGDAAAEESQNAIDEQRIQQLSDFQVGSFTPSITSIALIALFVDVPFWVSPLSPPRLLSMNGLVMIFKLNLKYN